MKYFARINKENIGPLSLTALIESGIRPSTYIWYKGLDDWIKAEEDPEVCRAIRRYLAGLDPLTGGEISAEPTAEEQRNELVRIHRESASRGFFGIRGIPENNIEADISLKPNVSIIMAILATLLCFPITGLIAIFFAMRSKAYWKMGEAEGVNGEQRINYHRLSHNDARLYRMMMGITFFLALIVIGFVISRS